MRRPLCLDPDGPIFEMALSALDVEAQPGLHVGGELRLAEVSPVRRNPEAVCRDVRAQPNTPILSENPMGAFNDRNRTWQILKHR
jgi:hypothetical protein